MFWASPMSPTIRPTVTTSEVARDAPRSPRIRTRSISAPSRGASTITTTKSASGAGQCWWTRSCQYMNAISIPIAPWAMLKMPDVA